MTPEENIDHRLKMNETTYVQIFPGKEPKGQELHTGNSRPSNFPHLDPINDERLICIFDHGKEVKISYFDIKNLKGMQEIWDHYAEGWALDPPRFIITKQDDSLCKASKESINKLKETINSQKL